MWKCFSSYRQPSVNHANQPPAQPPHTAIANEIFTDADHDNILQAVAQNTISKKSESLKHALFAEVGKLISTKAPQVNDHQSAKHVLEFTEKLSESMSKAYGKNFTGMRFNLRKNIFNDAFDRSEKKSKFCLALVNTQHFTGKNTLCRELALKLFDEQHSLFSRQDFKGHTRSSFAYRNLKVIKNMLQLSAPLTKDEIKTLLNNYPKNPLFQNLQKLSYRRSEIIEQLLVNYPATGKRAHRTHPAAQVLHDLIGASCHPVEQDNIIKLIDKNNPVSIPNISNTLMQAIFNANAKENLRDFLIFLSSTPNPCYEGIVEHLQDYQPPEVRSRLTAPRCPKWETSLTKEQNLDLRMEYVERCELILYNQIKDLKLTNNDQQKIFEITTSKAFGEHLANRKEEIINRLTQQSEGLARKETSQWFKHYLNKEYS